MLTQDIEWSQDAFSLADFEYTFGNELPQLIRVTDGFDGNELLHSFASEETYLVYSVACQSRVVVHDTRERLLSIPLDYHLAVRELTNGIPGRTRSLKQTITDIAAANFSANAFLFSQNQPVTIQKGASEMTQSQCGVMELVDIHKQRYLIGFSVVDGVVDHRPVLIPLYLPILVEVATCLGGRSARLSQSLVDLIPAGLTFKPDGQFNREIMAVSFADIDGDGYEYVNPAGRHQTMTRISAKISGLRNQAHLSLPTQWVEASHELDEALNGGDHTDLGDITKQTTDNTPNLTSPSSTTTNLEHIPSDQSAAAAKPHKKPKGTNSGNSPFLGAMRSISMFDLSSGQGLTTQGIGRETPTEKYLRRSEHYTKPDTTKSHAGSKQFTKLSDVHQGNISLSCMNISTVDGDKSRPSVPPKPKKAEITKKKAKHWFGDTNKKYSVDTDMMKRPWSKERPSLRNAKSMTDLHKKDTFDPGPTFSISPMHVIDRKPQMRVKQNKLKTRSVSTSDVDLPKRKSMPLLSRLSGLFSGLTPKRSDRPKVPPKPKDKKRKKAGRADASVERYSAISDIELAEFRLSDGEESVYAESESGYSDVGGGNSIYADIPAENTMDLLSDIRRATKEIFPPAVDCSADDRGAPELPPRNSLPPVDTISVSQNLVEEQMPQGMSTTVSKEKPDSVPSPTKESDGSFAYDFSPSTVIYHTTSSGHLAEPESEGESSDSTDSCHENDEDGDRKSATNADEPQSHWLERKTEDLHSPLAANRSGNINAMAHGAHLIETPKENATETAMSESGTKVREANVVIGVTRGPVNLQQQESGYWSPEDSPHPRLPAAPKPPVPIKPVARLTANTQGSHANVKYRSWTDIPQDISQLTVQDLVDSLHLLKMTRHAQAFLDNDIDGELLLELDHSVLQNDFGFSAFDSKKLVKFAKGWRPKLL